MVCSSVDSANNLRFPFGVVRPLLSALDVGQLDEVQWMLTGEKTAEDELCRLVDHRDQTAEYVNYFQAALAMRTGSLKNDAIFLEMAQFSKELEAHLVESKPVACHVPCSVSE